MPYNSKILDYASRRKHFGALDESNEVGVGYVGNAACGDMLKVYIKVNEHNIIEDVKVKSYGCGCAIASTALAAEKLMGKSVDDALRLTDAEIAAELDLPGIKKHCSVLAQSAVKKAVENYRSKANERANDKAKDTLNTDSEGYIELEMSKNELLGNNLSNNEKKCCNSVNDSEQVYLKQEKKMPNTSMEMFTVTPQAQARFYEIIKLYPEARGIIISSQAGGCAGNSYNLEIAKDIPSAANEYQFNDLTIFVPKHSLMFVLGVTIDYESTDTQAGFKFINPNAKMCGCGSSFR